MPRKLRCPALTLAFIAFGGWCTSAQAQAGAPLQLRPVANSPKCSSATAFCIPDDSTIVTDPPQIRFCPTPANPPATPIGTLWPGEVRIQFVIDTTGAAEPSSLTIEKSSDRHFDKAARQIILGCRYIPGRVGTRVVRVLAEQVVHIQRPAS